MQYSAIKAELEENSFTVEITDGLTHVFKTASTSEWVTARKASPLS
jgi:hypothetical protein